MEQPTNTTDTKSLKQITPEVTWAQRSSNSEPEKNHIFLTISVPDVDPKNIELDIQPGFLNFTGYSETKKATYHVKIDFYAEIEPKESRIHHTPRDIELVLQKKDLNEEYWPRLLKDKSKVHYLKTNFDKWVDEDEQDAVAEGGDDDYMSRMGGAGGMPGAGGDGGFGGIDFSKLGGAGGGMGGMGGMDMEALKNMAGGMGGMGGMGDMDEGDDDEDDEEMPELEDEKTDAASGASATSSKIEEVE